MSKEEYLEKLKVFDDFKFFPDDHHYEYKGERVGISVTRLIEEYSNEFEADTIAERVAYKQGKTTQEVLAEWQYKNDFACHKGSTCHEYAQSLWSGEKWKPDKFDGSDDYKKAVAKIKKQADGFKNDYKDRLEHLADELIIGSTEYDVASAIDHLFYNTLTEELVLVDYKTNSWLTGYNKKSYGKKMKPPLHTHTDDALNHYYIQLSIYKYFLEQLAEVEVGEMFIVYMSENEDNYKIIEVPYLEKEVKEILEWRKWN